MMLSVPAILLSAALIGVLARRDPKRLGTLSLLMRAPCFLPCLRSCAVCLGGWCRRPASC